MDEEKHINIPGLIPDEETVKRVNEIFGELDMLPDALPPKQLDVETPKVPKFKLKEPVPLTIDEEQFAVRMAKKELQKFHSSFIDFTESVGDTMLYAYVSEDIFRLSEAFNDMERLVNKKIDVSKLTAQGQENYDKMLSIRKRILNDMYVKYRKN